jgi:hypothetical protein
MSDTHGAQEAQDCIILEVAVEGFDDWRDALAEEVELEEMWAKEAGKDTVSLLELCDIEARLNHVTREIKYFSTLINMGYVLEEAVVSFDTKDWDKFGKCTWVKDHEAYSDPNATWRKIAPDATDYDVSLVSARFHTENGGEQRITLSSVAMSYGFLFHKTLRFHRMVFSKPKKEETVAV